MRGIEPLLADMFSYVDMEARIPKEHVIGNPPRKK